MNRTQAATALEEVAKWLRRNGQQPEEPVEPDEPQEPVEPPPDEEPVEPDKPPVVPNGGNAPSFSAKHLAAILPNLKDPEGEFPFVEAALLEFGITSFDRVAQFFGQVASETGGGQWFQELDNAAGTYLKSKPYYPYFGRGAIHLTWKENYQRIAEYFKEPALLNKPSLVSQRAWRWRTAGWFWRMGNGDINNFADRADFDSCMARVLGTANHPSYDTRWNNYVRACQTLPIPFALNGEYRWKIDRALAYILPARGDITYRWWLSGPLREGPPGWSKNAAAPPIAQIHEGFCASIPTLMRRRVGKEVPYRTNLPAGVDPAEWDGGIAAYFGGVFGGAYFDGYMHTIQNADADRPHGTLLGSQYFGSAAQGHVGIVLGNGRFLDLNSVTHFTSRYWVPAAIRTFKLTRFVWPWDWINYEGDNFERRAAELAKAGWKE